MIERYRTLAQRIRMEIDEIERTQTAILRHWQTARVAAADQDAYLNSVALNLHSWYSGVERVFELIAVEIDGGALGGEAWHSELLQQMTLDLQEARPPVIQKNTAVQLDEYRKFRHRIRNIYATSLDPARMQPLISGLPDLWSSVRRDLLAFLEFLDALAHTD
jgi:hypothetical protein